MSQLYYQKNKGVKTMGQKVNPIGLRLGINKGWDKVKNAKKRILEII